MRATAIFLTATIALGATPVRAEEVVVKQRGFLSGLGIGLLIGGVAGLGAGFAGVLGATDASTRLAAYGPSPSALEQPTVTALQNRLGGSTALAVVGFVGGGLALAGGVICLIVDTPKASIAFVPTSQGGVLVFSGRF